MPVSLHELGDLFLRLVRVGVEAQKDDALAAVGVIQLDQAGDVKVADGAIRAEEHQDDRLLADEAIKRDRAVGCDVLQCEVGDALHDAAIDRQLGLRVGGTGVRGGRRQDHAGPERDDGQEHPRTRPADDSLEHDNSLGSARLCSPGRPATTPAPAQGSLVPVSGHTAEIPVPGRP